MELRFTLLKLTSRSRQAQFAGDQQHSTDLVIGKHTSSPQLLVIYGYFLTDLLMDSELDVEVDGQWGPYLQCNPVHNTDPQQGGWFCRYYEQPEDWPRTCGADAVEGHANLGLNTSDYKPFRSLSRSTMDACCKTMHEVTRATAFAYKREENTCGLYHMRDGADWSATFYDPNSVVGFKTSGPPACNCSRMYKTVGRNSLPKGANGIPLAGEWYSVPAGGECKTGQQLGDDGCTWRLLRERKQINATCMYARIDTQVERHGLPCFNACTKNGLRKHTRNPLLLVISSKDTRHPLLLVISSGYLV